MNVPWINLFHFKLSENTKQLPNHHENETDTAKGWEKTKKKCAHDKFPYRSKWPKFFFISLLIGFIQCSVSYWLICFWSVQMKNRCWFKGILHFGFVVAAESKQLCQIQPNLLVCMLYDDDMLYVLKVNSQSNRNQKYWTDTNFQRIISKKKLAAWIDGRDRIKYLDPAPSRHKLRTMPAVDMWVSVINVISSKQISYPAIFFGW